MCCKLAFACWSTFFETVLTRRKNDLYPSFNNKLWMSSEMPWRTKTYLFHIVKSNISDPSGVGICKADPHFSTTRYPLPPNWCSLCQFHWSGDLILDRVTDFQSCAMDTFEETWPIHGQQDFPFHEPFRGNRNTAHCSIRTTVCQSPV
jgi:hypothetical protein